MLVVLTYTIAMNAFIGLIIGNLINNMSLGLLIGFILIWLGIDFLWVLITGHHITVLAILIILAIQFVNLKTDLWDINDKKNYFTSLEILAVLSVGIYTIVISEQIRWF